MIGENGAGKSTLMNILGGNVRPDCGAITLRGKPYAPGRSSDATDAGIAFIHQELNLFTNLSVADNLYIQNFPRRGILIRQKEKIRRTQEWLDALHLDIAPGDLVGKLQPGERQMVEIAKALSTGADIIIFDEPTTSLTSRETRRLFDLLARLKKDGKTIIYISHILKDIKSLCDRIVVLRDGELVDSGAAADFDIDQMIASMCGRDIKQLFPEFKRSLTGKVILKVDQMTQKGVVKDIDFQLHSGEVLGLFGLMGSGRSECARLIFGLESFDTGEITVGKTRFQAITPRDSIHHKMAFVTEDRRSEGLLMDASIEDNAGLVSLRSYGGRCGMINSRPLNEMLQKTIDSLHVKCGSLRQIVKHLSGGNQQKVVIGKWIPSDPLVFILDEPTRGIDVGAKFEIYSITSQLAVKGAGILFISSELEELTGLCDRILVMRQGRMVGEFPRQDFAEHQILQCAFGEKKCEVYE